MQDHQTIIEGRGVGRHNPAFAIGLELINKRRLDARVDIMNFVAPAFAASHKAQGDRLVEVSGRRQQAVSGGKRQMRRDKGGGTEIAAFSFQLANGVPGGGGDVSNGLTVILTKEQRLDLVGIGRLVIIISMDGNSETE